MRHDYYHVQEYTPQLRQLADKLISEIHAAVPELEVLFMGAAALGLPGRNDLDLDILCSQSDLQKYVDRLAPVLGTPQKQKDTMIVWNYMRDGVEIDCILSDPTIPNSYVPKQKKVFEALKVNPELQERYRRLKIECDGLPYEQYEAKKKAFLEEVAGL